MRTCSSSWLGATITWTSEPLGSARTPAGCRTSGVSGPSRHEHGWPPGHRARRDGHENGRGRENDRGGRQLGVERGNSGRQQGRLQSVRAGQSPEGVEHHPPGPARQWARELEETRVRVSGARYASMFDRILAPDWERLGSHSTHTWRSCRCLSSGTCSATHRWSGGRPRACRQEQILEDGPNAIQEKAVGEAMGAVDLRRSRRTMWHEEVRRHPHFVQEARLAVGAGGSHERVRYSGRARRVPRQVEQSCRVAVGGNEVLGGPGPSTASSVERGSTGRAGPSPGRARGTQIRFSQRLVCVVMSHRRCAMCARTGSR